MNKKEFADRVENVKKRLYQIAFLYLHNEASALEAVDEAVYKALRSLKKLREPQFFETWITRILINECKQEIKRVARMHPEETVQEEWETFDYDSLPLKEAIRKLPEELRAVITLRYFAGYTLAETSNILEIPQGTVVTWQRRALSLLKLELM
ncbi:MAG: sigma-70 family RNA polymerase sigma factor [Lachnospiraceae bacterium]|nr:sigma-70 family RNA polymerase sigma factor [Lachnospiraceae bacterium]